MKTMSLFLTALLLPSLAWATPNILADGDFELGVLNGSDYWLQSSTSGLNMIRFDPPRQSHIAVMGGQNNGTWLLTQTFELEYEMVQLLWMDYIASNEPCGYGYDVAYVMAHTPSHGFAYVTEDLCVGKASWRANALDITGYPGERLTVTIIVQNDFSVPSDMRFDDFSTR